VTALVQARDLLATAARVGDHLCLATQDQHDITVLVAELDSLITGTQRDYIATDRAAAREQVCAMSDQMVRDLLSDLLAARHAP